MATQTTKSNDQQNQASQGQPLARSSQQQATRRGGTALGLPITPAEFFRMSPFAMMRRMSEEFDRMLGEGNGSQQIEKVWAPAIEVSEDNGNYTVRAELPGLKPDEVKLEITEDAIVLQGERKEEHEENKGGVHLTERRYGRFYRAIPLPDGAKAEEARAKFENGILEVIVPTEQQKSKRREIPIQAAGSTGKTGSSMPSGSGSEKAA